MVKVNGVYTHGRYEKLVEKFASNVQCLSFCHPGKHTWLITQIHVILTWMKKFCVFKSKSHVKPLWKSNPCSIYKMQKKLFDQWVQDIFIFDDSKTTTHLILSAIFMTSARLHFVNMLTPFPCDFSTWCMAFQCHVSVRHKSLCWLMFNIKCIPLNHRAFRMLTWEG